MTLTAWVPDDELTSERLNAMVTAFNSIEGVIAGTDPLESGLLIQRTHATNYALTAQNLTGGSVASVGVSLGGSGYANSFAVTFSGGGGSGAAGTATASGGVVQSVAITDPGEGYTSPPTPDFSAGGGTGALGYAVMSGDRAFRVLDSAGTQTAALDFNGLVLAAGKKLGVGGAVGATSQVSVQRTAPTDERFQVMADFVYTSASAVAATDTTAFRAIGRQTASAGGTSQYRAAEISSQTFGGASGDATYAIDVTTMGPVAGNGTNLRVGIAIRAIGAIWGVSSPVRQDTALLIGGDYEGFTNAILCQDLVSNSSATLFKVSGVDGTVTTRNVLPDGDGTRRVGNLGSLYLAMYAYVFAAGAGAANGPSITFAADTDTGLFNAAANALGLTTAATERMRLDAAGNVVVGTAALATTATDGFLYIPTCAGTPTGVPTAYTGRAPLIFDTSANKLWAYDGGWIGVVLS